MFTNHWNTGKWSVFVLDKYKCSYVVSFIFLSPIAAQNIEEIRASRM